MERRPTSRPVSRLRVTQTRIRRSLSEHVLCPFHYATCNSLNKETTPAHWTFVSGKWYSPVPSFRILSRWSLLSPVTESTTLVTLIGGQKKIHMPLLRHINIACLPVYGSLSKIFNPNFGTTFYRTKLAGIPAKWITRSTEECFFGYTRLYQLLHTLPGPWCCT